MNSSKKEASSWLERCKQFIQTILRRLRGRRCNRPYYHRHQRFDIETAQHHHDHIERARCWTSFL